MLDQLIRFERTLAKAGGMTPCFGQKGILFKDGCFTFVSTIYSGKDFKTTNFRMCATTFEQAQGFLAGFYFTSIPLNHKIVIEQAEVSK